MSENNRIEDCIAATTVALISIFGLISNGLSLYVTRTRSRFRNAFGILCSSFLICNLQAIFVHFMWCTIVLSLKSPILSSPKLFSVRLVGVFLNGAWFGSILMHFLTAINRFFAFVYATRYNQLWSEARTFKIAIIFWTISMVYCTHHLYKNCSLLFNSGSKYRWLHHTSYHGQICAKIDGLVSVILIISMAFIDFITLLKILAYRRTMRRNTTESTVSDINEKEVLFFKQVIKKNCEKMFMKGGKKNLNDYCKIRINCINITLESCKLGLLYISCAVTYNIPSYLLIDKWMLFI
ncbi:unnamed protein product, partial [Wuchereria bancrofti]